ncbi:zinc dependent phospholipase C family protein [Eisenibacter elegans]|uniref:zinc dependent phospholipase C family protein n=1 Tax=Eisenibacter elegans TaxID=997 RepID=UPI00316AC48B
MLIPNYSQAWGFFGHRLINRTAVFTLPPEMIVFYKYYIIYITEKAVNPDARRYAVEGEAPKHFIDADVYDKYYGGKGTAIHKLPRYWKDAVAEFGADTLLEYGTGPWNVEDMKHRLTRAFERRDAREILRLSSDLGHYVADINVPLHTTENYNGQFTNQRGIHGFWESRLPELFSNEYDLFVGQARYLENTQLAAWEAVINAHMALDSVFDFERILTERFDESKKYSFEQRGRSTIKTYSRPFSEAYHNMLAGQVERRFRASIKMVGDFWYTCWVDAGKPDLEGLISKKVLEEEMKEMEEERQKEQRILARPHETLSYLMMPWQSKIMDNLAHNHQIRTCRCDHGHSAEVDYQSPDFQRLLNYDFEKPRQHLHNTCTDHQH